MRDFDRCAPAAAMIAVVWAGTAGALTQPQTLRSGVATVPIYATVTTAEGKLVTDLRETDFEVYDNGRRQRLATFGYGTQALAPTAPFRPGALQGGSCSPVDRPICPGCSRARVLAAPGGS